MGKRSKSNKNKNTRDLHLGRVKDTEKIFDDLLAGICGGIGQERKAIELLLKNLSLLEERKLSYSILSKHAAFTKRLTEIHMHLVISQLNSQNYTEAFESWKVVSEYESSHLQKLLEPFKDLFLLRIKGEKKDKSAERLVRKTEQIIVGGKVHDPVNILFIGKVLLELSRLQMFEAVYHLSCLMMENEAIKTTGSMFLMFSCVDLLRYNGLDKDGYNHSLTKYALTLCEFPAKSIGEFHLSTSLIRFYAVIHGVEDEESTEHVKEKCIELMEKYIESQITKQSMMCYTCNTKSTPNCEVLICQGCRVASYCCKDHQRLNFLFNNKTGTRGLGHKHLCPVFKAHRKKKENIDSSKQGHLNRKFERACMRFFLSTLKSKASKRMIISKQNEHQCDLKKGFNLYTKSFLGLPF
ncbi:predicted protein [Chaetoceros tenuissimus]|uniref:MYND-type domain-containing protein n=1 Tax=Chaetoceros tenuissimus TaxID=426638 RepID=A0AAD3D366_9STRA|nr:predicted protein [Chaetoceros tenuissimus]